MGNTYNGWTNYETWNVALWIDNEEGSYYAAREIVAEADPVIYPVWADTVDEQNAYYATVAGDALRDWVDDANPLNDLPASTFTDLLNAALSEVNWSEIAESILSEQRESAS